MKESYLTFECQDLVKEMQDAGEEKAHFSFAFAGHRFDCIFAFCHTGYEILIGLLNDNTGFTVALNERYTVRLSQDDYFLLCRILDLNYSADHFSSNTFLNLLNKNLPKHFSGHKVTYGQMLHVTKRKLPCPGADLQVLIPQDDCLANIASVSSISYNPSVSDSAGSVRSAAGRI